MNQFSGNEFEGTSISQLLNNQDNTQPPLNPNFMVQNPPFYNPHVINNQNNNMNNIQDLVNNINNNNNYDNSNRSSNNNYESDLDFIVPKKKIKRKSVNLKKKTRKSKKINNNTKINSKYFGLFNIKLTKDTKELLLIIFIYVLMSSSFVKKTIGQYISLINPNEFGKYSYISIILYGLILGVIFILLKKLIL